MDYSRPWSRSERSKRVVAKYGDSCDTTGVPIALIFLLFRLPPDICDACYTTDALSKTPAPADVQIKQNSRCARAGWEVARSLCDRSENEPYLILQDILPPQDR
ncbi:hypothetical protein EVAR_53577_1 [Eumeta japonica]|uniref:Uncharacterized protein n=1 Tax=Eumeta variegata TaxID=151549 RepID=A0A4C1YH94_EUMVA|nr:hypothetical protein EVAR_53577_1 [Eumeta japonica]